MRIKEGFRLRSVIGQPTIIGEGVTQMNFNKMIILNSSAEYLWKALEGKDFEIMMVIDLLMEEYDVDLNRSTESAQKIISQWYELGLIE